MSKQGNISSNRREKRTSFKLGLFNVSFHYDLPFLLRVPHLNNTFSESDRLTPLPATRRAHSRVPARKLCLVHVKHREWSRAFSCRFFPRLRHTRLARSNASPSRSFAVQPYKSNRWCDEIREEIVIAGCELRYKGEIQLQLSTYCISETSHVANTKPVCLKWYITKPKKSHVCINLLIRDNLASDLRKLVTLIE